MTSEYPDPSQPSQQLSEVRITTKPTLVSGEASLRNSKIFSDGNESDLFARQKSSMILSQNESSSPTINRLRRLRRG